MKLWQISLILTCPGCSNLTYKLKRWDTLLPNRCPFYHSHSQYIGYFGESSKKKTFNELFLVEFLQNGVASDHRQPVMSLLGCNEVYVIFQQIINSSPFLQRFFLIFVKEGGGGGVVMDTCVIHSIFFFLRSAES